jgi:hypothetical protein
MLLLAWTALIFWVLGQIWFCQHVVYPLFARVGHAEYIDYHHFYGRRIPLPVIVPGFASFVMPVALALYGPSVPTWMTWVNLAGGAGALWVTVVLEIPRHVLLERGGKNGRTIDELIRYNWPRTLAITAQALVTLAMWHHLLGAT